MPSPVGQIITLTPGWEEEDTTAGGNEVQEDQEFPPFLSKPDEIILKVLVHLEPTDIANVSQTCTRMRLIAEEDEKLWKRKCEEALYKKYILNSRDRQSLSVRSNENSFTFSPFKANFIKHLRRERIMTRNPIRQTVLDGSGASSNLCREEIYDNRIFWEPRRGNTVKVSCVFTGDCLLTLTGHTDNVRTIQVNQDFVISGGKDKTLKVWSPITGAFLRTLLGHTEEVVCSHLREDVLVSGSEDMTVRVWNVREGTCLNILEGHEHWVRCVHLNGSIVASGGEDRVIKIWDQETSNCLQTLHGHSDSVLQIKFYGDLLVSAGRENRVKVWDMKTGACRHTIQVEDRCNIALEDNILVTGHQDKTAKIWDILTGACLITLEGPHKHTCYITSVHVEGTFVVTASMDGTIKMWNRKRGEFVRNLLELQEGWTVRRMRMDDAKIMALVQNPPWDFWMTEIVALNFGIEC